LYVAKRERDIGKLILCCGFLAEVANQMPAVVRVFEAATQRETTKTAHCSKGEVGKKVLGFLELCPLTNCIVVYS